MPEDSPSFWMILFALFFLLALWGVLWFRLRDRSYLKKPTREALSPSLKKEIEEEKKVFEEHQNKFNAALEKARNKK